MSAQLEHIVARNLRIIGREIARLFAFIMMGSRFPVRFNRQVASATAGRPAQVAGETRHLAFFVREIIVRDSCSKFELASIRARFAHELGTRSLKIETRVLRIDRVFNQTHAPFQLWIEDGTLNEVARPVFFFLPLKAALPIRIANKRQVVAARRCSWPRRQERGICF